MFSSNTSQVSEDRLYVEDVFSTYLYTGNGSTQTITNGIDLAGKGGLVWTKARDQVAAHWLVDTTRGMTSTNTKVIYSNLTNAQDTLTSNAMTANANGYTLGSGLSTYINISGYNFASWTFRKAPKFFDVVTWSGNSTYNRQISHSLGVTPGFIIVKCTSTTSNWVVYHRSSDGMYLNTTAAASSTIYPTFFGDGTNAVAPTATNFTVGGAGAVNETGQTYVAYLFAHDATSDGIIQCGSFTTDGSGFATVNLGWEAQWALVKRSDSTGAWAITDNMRGWATGAALNTSDDAVLFTNVANAETTQGRGYPTATGFSYSDSASAAYIYIAIRRGPMRAPTTGTSVFQPITYTGSGTNGRLVNTSLNPDMVWLSDTSGANMVRNVFDRLRGNNNALITYGTNSESNLGTYGVFAVGRANDLVQVDTSGAANTSAAPYIMHNFKRAPGFFDEVCYTGTGSVAWINHNLGATPELIIVKQRSSAAAWAVGSSAIPKGVEASSWDWGMNLNSTAAASFTNYWNNASPSGPTSTQFRVQGGGIVNASGSTYVAYLFASCPGVSKVGSYTGNGSSQTINCGFSGGARFVLIKRTDSTGNWLVGDTARGLVAGNDPLLYLNSTAAEITTLDWLDTDSSGFVVNQDTTANANVNGATYIYLAVA